MTLYKKMASLAKFSSSLLYFYKVKMVGEALYG